MLSCRCGSADYFIAVDETKYFDKYGVLESSDVYEVRLICDDCESSRALTYEERQELWE